MAYPVDLHAHSTASDGELQPRALIQLAHDHSVEVFALTDHDTLAGLVEAQLEVDRLGIELVNGVELSAEWDGREIHVLGLFVGPDDEGLIALSEARRVARRARVVRICDRLAEMGIHNISAEAIIARAACNVGRPHVAQALVDGGHCKDVADAFHRFLGRGKAAYTGSPKPSAEEAIGVIHGAGGLAVLAHPAVDGMYAEIETLADLGLDAIEVFHPSHAARERLRYCALAERLDLGVSGGSDYHHGRGWTVPGSAGLPRDAFDRLRARRSQT